MATAPLKPGDIVQGAELPPHETPQWSSAHIVRWCAAQQNWDRIHHDADYARNIAGLPGPVVNGALKQNLVVLFLLESFPDGAWVWEVDWSSQRPDFVGDALRLEGRIVDVRRAEEYLAATVQADLRNCSLDRITSSARATVCVSTKGFAITHAGDLPPELRGDEAREPGDPVRAGGHSPGVPAEIEARIGRELESIRSCIPVDEGRLRLYADALGCSLPMYSDTHAGAAGAHGSVVALPWFPAHALSMPPGAKPLSSDPRAMGREAVCEVGRDIPTLLGLPSAGLRSAGNRGRFHSLVRLGETVEATSRLLDVQQLAAERESAELLFRTRNEYRTTTGRLLLDEVTSFACRTAH
jgi:acyl dehydratase